MFGWMLALPTIDCSPCYSFAEASRLNYLFYLETHTLRPSPPCRCWATSTA